MALPVTSKTLVANFDAGTIGQSDNTAVASWSPTAGAEVAAAAQATAGQRPTFRTNRINGLPAVVFTTAGSSNLDTGAWGTSYAVPSTAFAVAKITNTVDANVFSGRTGVFDYLGVTGSGAQVAIGAGAAAETVATFTPGSSFHVYGATYNFAASSIYIDSATAAVTGSTGSAASSNMPGMRMGANSSGAANFPDMDLAEIAFYSGLLSAGEIFTVMAYLNAKYGLGLPGLDIRRRTPLQPATSRRRAANW